MAADPNKVVSVTIASGASLSPVISTDFYRLAGIHMPADWTAASLTFQASWNGVDFWDLYNDGGTEVSVTAAADQFIVMNTSAVALTAIPWLKIRSGTTGVAVVQAAARTLMLVLNL